MKQINCAIYTRKSSEEGMEQEFNSLDAQYFSCADFIKSQKSENWILIDKKYDDGGYSGGNINRPALKELLNDVQSGKIDVIVVYKIDRLTRSLEDFVKLVEIFESCNVSFISVTQQFNTSSSIGRLTLSILITFAQFEREITSERIRDKIQQSKDKGLWMGGPVPLGYNAKDRRLYINRTNANLVRYIFENYAEMRSVATLKKFLIANQDALKIAKYHVNGVACKPRKVFTKSGLIAILKNPIYIGKLRHKSKILNGKHSPIISQFLWEKVQKIIENPGPALQIKSPIVHLKGKVADDEGCLLAVVQTKKNGKYYQYFVSPNSKTTGNIRINSKHLEDIIYKGIKEFLSDKVQITVALYNALNEIEFIDKAVETAKSMIEFSMPHLFETILCGVIVSGDNIIAKLDIGVLFNCEKKHFYDLNISLSKRALASGICLIILPQKQSEPVYNYRLIKAIALAYSKFASLLKSPDEKYSYPSSELYPAFIAPHLVEKIVSGKRYGAINLSNPKIYEFKDKTKQNK